MQMNDTYHNELIYEAIYQGYPNTAPPTNPDIFNLYPTGI
jgi:hypothetical protein